MCKYCGSKKSKQTAVQQAQSVTFQAMYNSDDEDLVTVAAKSSVNLDTPKGTQHLRAGAVTSLPVGTANKLIAEGAPIWIT